MILQDIALWAAYANVEGAAGHINTARKVFDTTLASLLALPKVQIHVSICCMLIVTVLALYKLMSREFSFCIVYFNHFKLCSLSHVGISVCATSRSKYVASRLKCVFHPVLLCTHFYGLEEGLKFLEWLLLHFVAALSMTH